MNRFFFPVLVLLSITIACNNSGKKNNDPGADKTDVPKTTADSLMKDIDDGHMMGMSKMAKLHNTRKEVQRIIDSIGTLPAKAQQSVAPYLARLQSVIKDLDYADFGMDKWMTEFDMDSALDNLEQRIKYLTEEKLKVEKMKEAMLTSLQKADSILKAKF